MLKNLVDVKLKSTIEETQKTNLKIEADLKMLNKRNEVERAVVQLFENDRVTAMQWLNEPAKGLGGKTPLDRLDMEGGANEVLDLIGRIENGIII